MNVILVWALMGDHMLLEHEPNFGSTMGAVGGVGVGNVEAHELQESKHGARHRWIQVKKHEPSMSLHKGGSASPPEGGTVKKALLLH